MKKKYRIKTPKDMLKGTKHNTTKSGVLEIVEYYNAKQVRVKFVETNYETIAQVGHVRRGSVKDPYASTVYNLGCFGEGEFTTSSPQYVGWTQMLRRIVVFNYDIENPEWLNFNAYAEAHS